MDFGLTNRTAFVAGASKGLGRAAARELAQEGCRVALCSRDEDRIAVRESKIHECAWLGGGKTRESPTYETERRTAAGKTATGIKAFLLIRCETADSAPA